MDRLDRRRPQPGRAHRPRGVPLALVWPENHHEAALLHAALGVVAADPPRMLQGDALGLVSQTGAALPTGQALDVFHAATRAQGRLFSYPRY